MRSKLGLLLCLGLVTACGPILGDVVTMVDGKRFEGAIVEKDDRNLKLDTMVGRVRVLLKLSRREIDSVVENELPTGFFDPPPAPSRVSKAEDFRSDQTLYLEVPVSGGFGETVFADGIAKALSYAERHRIRHVVFSVDSTGGNLDEALDIYALLKEYHERLNFHAIVRNCIGDALAVPVWCRTVNLVPGAVVGGAGRKLRDISDKYAEEEEEVIRAQLIDQVIEDTDRSGRAAGVLRAMLDPSYAFAAWRDEDGAVVAATDRPASVPRDRVILEAAEGKPLQLSYDQALAMGMPAFEGGAEDLGELLKLSGWTKESDYGAQIVAKTAAAIRKKAEAKQAAYESKVRRNVTRRESTERYIQNAMRRAAEWDPTKASYQTYSYRWSWDWGWSRYSESRETGQLTKESQKKWRNRTDACAHYLRQAAKGLNSMRRLDKEAVKLGLEPTYKPGEVDMMLKDIKVRFAYLRAHRNKTTQ